MRIESSAEKSSSPDDIALIDLRDVDRLSDSRAFVPEQFSIKSDFDDLVIEPKAACQIANAVYKRNNRRKYPNNTVWSTETPVIVDTAWDGRSALPYEVIGYDPDTDDPIRSEGYTIHVPYAHANAGTDAVNKTFAFSLQRLFDKQERKNRASTPETLCMGGIISGISMGPIVAVGSVAPDMKSAVIASIPAAPVILPVWWATIGGSTQNLYRRAVTNAESKVLNRKHMINTLKHIGRLGLKPMIYEIER